MSQNDTVMEDVEQGTPEKGNRADRVSEYLQAPRRKRKSYVLLALGKGTNASMPPDCRYPTAHESAGSAAL